MSRIVLVHWHAEEAKERAARLRARGHPVTVHCDPDAGSKSPALRSLVDEPPDAVVIDLQRLPAHGNAIATWIRERKATRALPLVFVPGDAEKTARVRARFPDAVFAPWSRLVSAVKKAIAAPPRAPVVPKAPDYSGRPLPQKLGLKAGGRLVLVRAPAEFAATLGDLPADVAVATRVGGEANVVVLFCRALQDLRADFARAAATLAERGGLWVAWPKQKAGVTTDLDGNRVRAFGLDQGLVDNKICAIDATWSALRFARPKSKRG